MARHTSCIRLPYALGQTLSQVAGVVAALAATACDVPTELPEIQSRWVVPLEETRFGVGELLPGDVTISLDSLAFVVDFDTVAFLATLEELCGLRCTAADGLTVPKPPFSGTVESAVEFPPEVHGISVLAGLVQLEVENLFGFDPIRPGAGGEGLMTLRVTDDADGDVLSELVVDGADTAFPSGTSLTRNLSLDPTLVNGGLRATVVLDSPLGDSVTVDADATFSVVARPMNIRVGSVDVDVSNRSVTFDPVALEVDDIDQELRNAVVEGAFILDVVNPFGIGADFDMSIDGPTIAPIQRSVSIGAAPVSTLTIDFTGAELRSFLGERDVELTGGAVVNAGAGIITLGPGEELVLDATLDVTVTLGGGDD